MIVQDKYVVVIHETDKYHISNFYESARVETIQEIIAESNLEDIDIKKLPKLKEGEEPEKNKIYNVNGKAIIIINNGNKVKFNSI